MIAIIDCGLRQTGRIERTLNRLGIICQRTDDPKAILASDGVILTGIGSFGDGMQYLVSRQLDDVLWKVSFRGIPLLGVGLGMHLLFSEGEISGLHRGLNILAGTVKRLPETIQVPHVGWNELVFRQPHPLVNGLADDYVYFSHSYYVEVANQDDILAMTDNHYQLAALVGRGQTFGMQFYPEISGMLGQRLLERFAERCVASKKEWVS